MPPATRRDPDVTRRTLESWLSIRTGAADVTVSDLTLPRAGFSNETIYGRAEWTDHGGVGGERPFVLRIEPSQHQLFVEPDAIRQAQVMQSLAGSVPVPTVWLTESDPTLLGAPFFLMDRVSGQIPPDVPSWHRKGWTTHLSPTQRELMYRNGVAALVSLHEVEWRSSLPFLEPPGHGTGLDRYLQHLERWYEWCAPVRRVGADVMRAALDYVLQSRPDTSPDSDVIVWGDARPGNMIFAEDLSVAAMLDWEGATVGPCEIDLGWWLMFEEYLCEAQGLQRLEGVPGRVGTVALYEELSGRSPVSLGYYEILAGLVFSLINSRLADLLVSKRIVEAEVAEEFVWRVVAMVRRGLDEA